MEAARPWLDETLIPIRQIETFTDVIDAYLKSIPDASKKYRHHVSRLGEDLGPLPITRLSDGLTAFIEYRRHHPSKLSGKPLSGASINRMMQIVFAALNYTIKAEYLIGMPISKARFRRFKEMARDRYLSDDEMARLYSTLEREAPHLLPITRFALQVPCRKSELVNARRKDLHIGVKAIRIQNGETKNGDGLWKPIPPDMLGYFEALPRDTDFLFFRRDWYGVAQPLGEFKRAWWRALKIAGIECFRFHDTRHIAVTDMLNAGTPKEIVSQIAGWKTDMIRHYYHLDGVNAIGLVRWRSGHGNT